MKIAYIGIDLFYTAIECFENLGCEIIKIFTCETDNKTEFNTKIIEFAKNRDIPYTLKKMTKENIEELKNCGCQMIVCAGYYYKLPFDAKLPMLNIHPSLLPIGRGGWPMPLIIKKRFLKSGVSIHKISKKIDEGDIVLQKEFFLDKRENLKTYMQKIYDILPSMIKELIDRFDELYENATRQSDYEYWQLPSEEDYTVNHHMSMKEADIILRAFFGYEVIYKGKDKVYEIIEGVVSSKKDEAKFQYFALKDGYIKVLKSEELK